MLMMAQKAEKPSTYVTSPSYSTSYPAVSAAYRFYCQKRVVVKNSDLVMFYEKKKVVATVWK